MKKTASFAAALVIVLVVGFTHTVAAQDTTVVEIKKGEVLRVLNNTVVVRVEGEGVRTYVVPYDFKFNHEGQEITVRELRAGHQLTSVRLRTVGAPQDIAEEDVATLTVEDSDAPADVAEAAAMDSGGGMSPGLMIGLLLLALVLVVLAVKQLRKA